MVVMLSCGHEVNPLRLGGTVYNLLTNAYSIATMLRLPSLVKFSPHVEECLHVLSTSPYAAPSDKWLCATVNLQRISEQVSIAFDMDDPGADVNFAQPRVQYQLKIFERQLENWQASFDCAVDSSELECVSIWIRN